MTQLKNNFHILNVDSLHAEMKIIIIFIHNII